MAKHRKIYPKYEKPHEETLAEIFERIDALETHMERFLAYCEVGLLGKASWVYEYEMTPDDKAEVRKSHDKGALWFKEQMSIETVSKKKVEDVK